MVGASGGNGLETRGKKLDTDGTRSVPEDRSVPFGRALAPHVIEQPFPVRAVTDVSDAVTFSGE